MEGNAESLSGEPRDIESIINNWSGRGSHVEFGVDEIVPLQQGRYLGRGVNGPVYETIVEGHKLAWKQIPPKRKMQTIDRKEIDILKKLTHVHMIRLVGTYTHRQFLGILLYPVAVCDLHTFFDDVEAYWADHSDETQRARLTALGYFPTTHPGKAWPIYGKIGCLISAIAYLHGQKIRHKDIKPSNILLSQDRLWLSDFGSATDFSLLSHSATDNDRGTLKYLAPEVAKWELNGRSADIFSLGCVLLEVQVIHQTGTLERLQERRTSRDPSYQGSLDDIEDWFSLFSAASAREHHLRWETRNMLSRDANTRPAAKDILKRVTACDDWTIDGSASLFSDCCRVAFISTTQHAEYMRRPNAQYAEYIQRLIKFDTERKQTGYRKLAYI